MQLTSIHAYLKQLGLAGPVAYCPNPGNGGDALIAQATFQVFQDCQIDYQSIDPRHFIPQGQVVFYAGGGNLCRYYQDARAFIQRIHKSVSKLIILPHTIDGHEDLLEELGSNVDIICREEISYRHVQRHSKRANVFLADDMAFSLRSNEVLGAQLRRPWHHSPALSFLTATRRTHNLDPFLTYLPVRYQLSRTGRLNAFRTDGEATARVIPTDNYDISDCFAYGTADEYQVLLSAVHLLHLVSACRQLSTNRLHIAIAGALLGREVLFYANSYYKNQAIYDFSIKSRFPNVHWMESA